MKTIIAFTLLFVLSLPALAEDEFVAPGPKVGDTIPEFSLVDQSGEEQSLKTIADDYQHVAIVFHRSADW